MRDKEIDEILKQAAQAPHNVDPALLDRVANSIGSSLRPVRPLPPIWVLAGGLTLICAIVALAGAARAGFYGIQALSVLERVVIFPVLGILIWLGAAAAVVEMIPGSRRRTGPGTLLAAGSLALLVVFAILFHDYRTGRFVSQGIACLAAGLLHAIPAALGSWFLLRRGFAVNPVAAGLVVGTLAGLAGVSMLELHCQNLETLHVMVWHTAVMPVSAAAGALLGWAARFRSFVNRRSAP
ncbi:MAG: NrsF family protein [Bryobacteraceae bacterium]